MPWLNRFDADWLDAEVAPFEHVFVLEDHAPVGGLGDGLRGALARPRRHRLRRRRLARVRDARRGASLPRSGRRVARVADRRARRRPRSMSSKRAWIVLPDPLSIRIFVDAGIVRGLDERLGGELAVVFLVSREAAAEWLDRLPDVPVMYGEDAHGSPRASRPRAGADRRLARPSARLPPARDPPELPPRLPCRADAAGAPELDARHRPRRPAPALAGARAGDGALVLRARGGTSRGGCSRRCGGTAQASCSRTCSPRARCRSSPRRVACGCRWSRTSRAGTTRSERASSPRTAISTSFRTASWRTTCAATTGSSPERVRVTGWPQTDLFHRRRPRAEYEELLPGTGSTRAARSCSSRGTRRATHPTRGLRRAPRRVVGARRRRALSAPVPAAPARP